MVLRSINNKSKGGSNGGGGNSGGVDGMNLDPLPRTEIEQYYHLLTKASTTPPQHHHHQQQQHHSQSINKLTIITASELMGLKEGETLVALMRQSD